MNFANSLKGKMYTNFVEVSSYKLKKKGATKFSLPIYEIGGVIDEKTSLELHELDIQLTEYLAFYFKKPVDEIKKDAEDLVVDPTEY